MSLETHKSLARDTTLVYLTAPTGLHITHAELLIITN